jgi:hypothetical protein
MYIWTVPTISLRVSIGRSEAASVGLVQNTGNRVSADRNPARSHQHDLCVAHVNNAIKFSVG